MIRKRSSGITRGHSAQFTYSFAPDPLSADKNAHLEHVGFVVGLDAILADNTVTELRIAPRGAALFTLERSINADTTSAQVLTVSAVTTTDGHHFVPTQAWTIAGVGWRRGGAPGRATANLNDARERSRIGNGIDQLRQLARYLCDGRGTPWHFRVPG
jgi:hypothetical protein